MFVVVQVGTLKPLGLFPERPIAVESIRLSHSPTYFTRIDSRDPDEYLYRCRETREIVTLYVFELPVTSIVDHL